jgi:hypothetical protein
MASSITAYSHLWKLVTTGGLDLDTSEIRIRLVDSNYVFATGHTLWDNGANDATDPSHNELTTGSGYTAGGIQLVNPVVTNTTIDYDDVTWTALDRTFRAAIAVAVGSFGGVSNPVLFYLLFDTTPADIVSTGSNFSILWNATNKLFYQPVV